MGKEIRISIDKEKECYRQSCYNEEGHCVAVKFTASQRIPSVLYDWLNGGHTFSQLVFLSNGQPVKENANDSFQQNNNELEPSGHDDHEARIKEALGYLGNKSAESK